MSKDNSHRLEFRPPKPQAPVVPSVPLYVGVFHTIGGLLVITSFLLAVVPTEWGAPGSTGSLALLLREQTFLSATLFVAASVFFVGAGICHVLHMVGSTSQGKQS